MEQKSMGNFIATLRKENGLTQKTLAEKLNVSDKSISRWERDETTPDLSLIPVMAELFGVTSDELLRGERSNVEKKKHQTLAPDITKYINKSLFVCGVTLCGFIVALIGNFAFLRAYIGFFGGAIFFIAALILQLIFMNSALVMVNEQALKRKVIGIGEKVIVFIAVTFASTMPLLVYGDTYYGLSANSFLKYGVLFGVIALGVCCWICMVLNVRFYKDANNKWKKKVICIVSGMLVLTMLCNVALTGFGYSRLITGTTFDNWDEFKRYMEMDIPEEMIYGDHYSVSVQTGETVYYDEYGNETTREEANKQQILDESGMVLYEFVQRNESVSNWSYGPLGTSDSNDTNSLVFTAYTSQDYFDASLRVSRINMSFMLVYVVEIIGGVVVYRKKRI